MFGEQLGIDGAFNRAIGQQVFGDNVYYDGIFYRRGILVLQKYHDNMSFGLEFFLHGGTAYEVVPCSNTNSQMTNCRYKMVFCVD